MANAQTKRLRTMMLNRRLLTLGLSALALSAATRTSRAREPLITVSKDPNCGCCNGWIEHLRAAGFAVEARDTNEINRVKARLGVPSELASCHTAEVAGYVIEGHVPASSIRKLLAEKPVARGLAVPGMPVGSPGMEVPGAPPDDYAVILFEARERRTFARYRGTDLLLP
jgi:hypothetical protein